MNTTFKNLNYPHPDIDILLTHMEQQFIKQGGETTLKTLYREKLETTLNSKLKAEWLYDNDKIVGCYWLDLISPHYGNITLHSIEEKYANIIVDRLIQNGIFLNAQIEIVSISLKDIFKDLFKAHDLIINERQRMALWLEEIAPFHIPDDEHQFFFMSKDYCNITGALSYEAHLISKDYEHYPDMNSVSKRIKLEENVFNNRSGNVNKEASLMICKNNTIMGYCLVVDVKKCWGYNLVPWIFDISVHPNYMGQGLGKKVLQMSINALIAQGLPMMGLAATKTNTNAIGLYESLGFYWVDDFYEFIKPITL